MKTLTGSELSPNFTMEDIWKLREYNSIRRSQMTYDEVKLELDKSSHRVMDDINKIKAAKTADIH